MLAVRSRRLGRTPAPPHSDMPAYLAAMTADQWNEVPNSRLSDSGIMVSSDAWHILTSYSASVKVTDGIYVGTTKIEGVHHIPYGSGHTQAMDEVQAFGNMLADSPQWRLSRGRTSPSVQNTEQDGAGNPVCCHSYGTSIYVPSGNYWVRLGGKYRYTDSTSSLRLQKYSLGQSDPNDNMPWSRGADMTVAQAEVAALEPSTGRIWYVPAGEFDRLGYWDSAANTHTISADNLKNWDSDADRSTGAIDDTRHIFASFGGNRHPVQFHRTDQGVTTGDWWVPSTTGDTLPSDAYLTGFRESAHDEFICWGNGGKTFYRLTPPASNPYNGGDPWTVTAVTPGGGSTPITADNGTYQRFFDLRVADRSHYFLHLANVAGGDAPILCYPRSA